MPNVSTARDALERERRSDRREALVLRVGVISSANKTSFCLVRNISPTGMSVKVFGQTAPGTVVTIRVGDEEPISGRVAWVRDRFAGIEFSERLPPELLLRAAQKLAPTRRRSSPRVNTAAKVLLRTGGMYCSATLLDVSATGARVLLARPGEVGSTVMITLPDVPSIRAFVRWQEGRELGLAFEAPIPIEVIARWLDGRIRVVA